MTTGFLTFALVCAMARLQVVTPIQLGISPATYTEASSGVVTVSCSLNASDSTGRTILQLTLIGPGKKDLATVRKGTNKIKYGTGATDKSKFQGTGRISATTSFLRLVISNPSEDDHGLYTCKLDYADKAGLLQDISVNEKLAVEIFDIHNIVKQLQTELKDRAAKESQMLKTIEDLKAKCCTKPSSQPDNHAESDLLVRVALLENNIANILGTTTLLSTSGSQLAARVTVLEQKTKQIDQRTSKDSEMMKQLTFLGDNSKNNSQEIRHLVEQGMDITSEFLTMTDKQGRMSKALGQLTSKDSQKSAFAAAIGSRPILQAGDDVAFNSVIVGDPGYDSTTGKFTAPFHGLYAFQAVVALYCDEKCVSRVGLHVNGQLVARLWLGTHQSEDDQSSVSTVAVLEKGDVVHVALLSGTGRLEAGHYSVFSGFLVQAY